MNDGDRDTASEDLVIKSEDAATQIQPPLQDSLFTQTKK